MPVTDSTPPPTPEEVRQWRDDAYPYIGGPRPARNADRLVRLADAYTVAVEVAEMLASGDYAVADVCDALDKPHWHYIFREPPCEPMPPAHAEFLRAIQEEGEGAAG